LIPPTRNISVAVNLSVVRRIAPDDPVSERLLATPSVDERRQRMQSGLTMSKPKKLGAIRKEKKTPGTAAVEKYRPKMNKLTDAERERLMARAMVTIYGRAENADRR
jgi:hypothetical protein